MSTPKITDRELEIILLGAEGSTDKQIAMDLGIAHATVTTHWVRLREKLGAKSRGQVIAIALSRIYKQAQDEVREKNELFAALVQSLPNIAVFLLNRERKIMSWNPGVRRVLGYEEEEWLQLAGDVIFTEEDRQKGAPALEQASAESKGMAQDNRWHVRKDGSVFWSLGVMVPVRNENGKTLCYSKVLQEQTRIKRLEQRVRELGGNPDDI